MNTYYFIGDSLKKTRWENLTFDEYYLMSDEEKLELKGHLVSINAPFSSDLQDEEAPEGNYKTWMDIVSMSDEELEKYSRS